MRILFFGDIVGRPGREGIAEVALKWKADYQADWVIANGENAAGGIGINPDKARELLKCGIDIITLGNHAWQKREMHAMLDSESRLIRPANMPPNVPGKGWGIFEKENYLPIAVVSLCGRVFMAAYDDPFRGIDQILSEIDAKVILVDFHAEATSEKYGFAGYVDGRVSAVIGTHTHVQTADEKIMPEGAAYITDVGMCGAVNSVIGMTKESVIKKFMTGLPIKFEVGKGKPMINAVVIDINSDTGKANSIQRLNVEL